MSILTAVMPNQTRVQLAVAEGALVFDGSNFVEPARARQVALLNTQETPAVVAIKGVPAMLGFKGTVLAGVVGYDPMSEPSTDSALVSATDPSNGLCICGITCKGTNVAYVQVNYLEE